MRVFVAGGRALVPPSQALMERAGPSLLGFQRYSKIPTLGDDVVVVFASRSSVPLRFL